MDELIAAIIARLERNAADHRAIADLHGLTAGTWDRGKGEGFGSAARLVRQMWDEEQARIAEEERAEEGHGAPFEWSGEDFGQPCETCGEAYLTHWTPEDDMGLVLCPAYEGPEESAADPWEPVRSLPPTVAWSEENR